MHDDLDLYYSQLFVDFIRIELGLLGAAKCDWVLSHIFFVIIRCLIKETH